MAIYNSGNELKNIFFKGNPVKTIYVQGNNIYNKKHCILNAAASPFGGFINGFRNGGSDPVLQNFGTLTPNTLSGKTIFHIYTHNASSGEPAYLTLEPIDLVFKSIKIIQQDNGFVLGDFEYSSFNQDPTDLMLWHVVDQDKVFVNGKEYLIIFTLN